MFMDSRLVCGALALLAMAIGCNLGEEEIGSLTASGTGSGTGSSSGTGVGTGGVSSGSASDTSTGSTSGTAGSAGTATTTSAVSSATADTSSSGGDYERDCQPGDFNCQGFGCEDQDSVIFGECYKKCTPDSSAAIGEPDDECDEPQRPFCGQVGDPLGGDFDCNGCHHICVAAQGINVCEAPITNCGE